MMKMTRWEAAFVIKGFPDQTGNLPPPIIVNRNQPYHVEQEYYSVSNKKLIRKQGKCDNRRKSKKNVIIQGKQLHQNVKIEGKQGKCGNRKKTVIKLGKQDCFD